MKSSEVQQLVDGIEHCFISPNVVDSNFEAANVVDAIAKCAGGLYSLSKTVHESSLIIANSILQLAKSIADKK